MGYRAVPFFLFSLAPLFGCDATTAGQTDSPGGPPRLVRVVVVDLARGLATDLLDRSPRTACSDADRCAQGTLHCAVAAGADGGVCLDILDPAVTQPPVAAPGLLELHLVFDRPLDPASLVSGDADLGRAPDTLVADLLELDGPDGKPLALDGRYEPS